MAKNAVGNIQDSRHLGQAKEQLKAAWRGSGFTEAACRRYRASIPAPLHLSATSESCFWTGSGMWHDDTSFRSLWRRRSVLWFGSAAAVKARSEEHTSELQSLRHLVC